MSKDSVQYPEGNVLLRNLSKKYPIVERGDGLYLYDNTGKRYIDAASGALVVSCGHGNLEIAESVFEQTKKVSYVNGMQFTSEAVERFSERLAKLSPFKNSRVSLLSSGSEAIEAAIKFVRQLWVERGETSRKIFIARSPGYHGNTLFALSASARPHYKKFFGPLLHEIPMIDAPYEYRSAVDDYWNRGGEHYSKQLEDLIKKLGPENIAGFLIEPVSGSSIGANVPPHQYLNAIQKICNQHKILIIADEVLCGSGRTGKFFASDHWNFKPDVLVLGKGINSGLVPMSAVIVQGSHVEEIKNASGGFMHAQTYLHSPTLAATGNAVLDYFEKHNTLQNAQIVGQYFQKKIREILLPHSWVGHIAGIGMLAGVEFVQDKHNKSPFTRSMKFAEKFVSHCFENGLILWPNTGHADSVNGDLMMLGPPLNITTEQSDEIALTFQKCLNSFSP